MTMKLQSRSQSENTWVATLLQWLNLRPEEGERTFLTFCFYTTTCIGQLWLEQSAIALFLETYKAESLPIIYIASALIGSGLGLLYSWLTSILPLRRLLVGIAIFMVLPLILFRLGLAQTIVGLFVYKSTIFMMRLWMDGIDVLNDLNTSITANQLFNIREVKRTYPIISSGILIADVLSGFSLPFLINTLKLPLPNIIVMSAVMMFIGAFILYTLCERNPQSFPNAPAKDLEEFQSEYKSKKLEGSVKLYVVPLFLFFILGQVLFLLIEFQYSGELEIKFKPEEMASFLGIFSGVTGLFELMTQWFVSSRAIEKVGIFKTAMLQPALIGILSLLTLTGIIPHLLWGLVTIKFIDELFRYTLLASISPVFFQPLPENLRNSVQTTVRGVAQTLSTGATGLGILGVVKILNWYFHKFNLEEDQIFIQQSKIIVAIIVIFAILWFIAAWLLGIQYVKLL
ncbi:MAG TPA: MFS transporter, partial [Allocoleopsis sp.]